MSLTTSETIRAIWRTRIWNHASIIVITDRIIENDIGEGTLHEVSRLAYNQKINFYAFRVTRSIKPLLGGYHRVEFRVDVSYTKWADPDGNASNEVIDAIETVQNLVISELGETWGGTVEGTDPQEDPISVSTETIDDKAVFTAEFAYLGVISAQN